MKTNKELLERLYEDNKGQMYAKEVDKWYHETILKPRHIKEVQDNYNKAQKDKNFNDRVKNDFEKALKETKHMEDFKIENLGILVDDLGKMCNHIDEMIKECKD